MHDEKIKVRVTSTGQTLDVVVFSKRPEVITVVLGEGVHNTRCSLTPTRNGLAYAGNAWGARSSTNAARSRCAPRSSGSIRKYAVRAAADPDGEMT